jgi:hypothetical protein
MRTQRLWPLLASAALLGSCGGESSKPAAKPAGNPTPRVEGNWLVVSNPRARAQTTQGRWRIMSACPSGPCRFTVRSSTGRVYRFAFNQTTGAYTRTISLSSRCTPRSGRRSPPKRVSETSTTTLRVVAADHRSAYATQMTGESLARLVSSRARSQCREKPVRQFDLRVFRTDSPQKIPAPANPSTKAARSQASRGDDDESPIERLLAKLPGVPTSQERPSKMPAPAKPRTAVKFARPKPPPEKPSHGPTSNVSESPVERLLQKIPGLELEAEDSSSTPVTPASQ